MRMYRKIKQALALASGAIIAAPVKLPPKVVAVARYVALAVTLLDALEPQGEEGSDGR